MRGPWAYVSGLLDLHTLDDPAERRATWRQAVAALAHSSTEEGPSPLEGMHPDALAKGVNAAISAGLVDDLEWLAAPAAGAALYALAAALPSGVEQREIGRRVLARLMSANAETFIAIATSMAVGAGKGLNSPAVRARIALVTELPIGLGLRDGPMALGLATGRDALREWIVAPSTGSLPARRLAAKLLERAAREAATRALQGDDHAMRVFKGDALREAWQRLLDDRESLVWRHVAVARGLIAPWIPQLKNEITAGLAANMTPTEWRRAATSLAAMIAVAPEQATRSISAAIAGGLIERDRGVSAALVWGLARAAEVEPDAASTVLEEASTLAPFESAEAVAELFMELGNVPLVERMALRVADALAKTDSRKKNDDGADALAKEIERDLRRDYGADPPLRQQVAGALTAFATQGARAAHAAVREVLAGAKGALDTLDALAQDEDENAEGRGGAMARRNSLAVVRDLDITLLQRNVLFDLMKLGATSERASQHSVQTGQAEAPRPEVELDALRERLAGWILARESSAVPVVGGPGGAPESLRHPTVRLSRLRALLHLVDGDVTIQDDPQREARLQKRWRRIAMAILDRFAVKPPAELRRTLIAALARAFDTLVRAEGVDVTDVLLLSAFVFDDKSGFVTMAEASMDPDVIHAMTRYATFVTACGTAATKAASPVKGDSLYPPSMPNAADVVGLKLAALEELAQELFANPTSRSEVLRTVLMRAHATLKAVAAATTLRELVGLGNESGVLESLEGALTSIAQLVRSARGRLDGEWEPASTPRGHLAPRSQKAVTEQPAPSGQRSVASATALLGGPAPAPRLVLVEEDLSVAAARVVSGSEPILTDEAVSNALNDLTKDLPSTLADLVSEVLSRLTSLPAERASQDLSFLRVESAQLPAWMPARRTLGGFYVVRALGVGASGSVFLVNRVEDRHETDSEKFALKVPDFSATAARTLSEVEFLQMFRAEASALIALPAHKNLARFVTFDLAARPKPILVMEFVEGVTFEQVVGARALDMKRCLGFLDDILIGLDAMHGVGVGHLDLKPSNVVLRGGQEAVLVDFGLAGRNVRPGCATGPYGAPEVWGAMDEGVRPTPQAADIYAFGCVAFEALTGQVLFQADTEMAQVAMHIAHDGFPPAIKQMAKSSTMGPLAELLYWSLRRDPAQRPSVLQFRQAFAKLKPGLESLKWPLAV